MKLIEAKSVVLRSKDECRLNIERLSINQGEKIALIGSSGSGKTSLISVLNGSLRPTSGSVLFREKDIRISNRRIKGKIATLWQDLRLIEELNVIQNINSGGLGKHSLFWALRNLVSDININQVNSYLELVGLDKKYLTARLSELSGGQRQRVAIARLIIQKSEVILADEPLANLDPKLSLKLLSLLLGNGNNRKIKTGDTVVISLHRPDLVYYFDRVIGLKSGQLILDKPISKINDSLLNKIYNK